jgi:hypothetical protein
MFALLHFSSCIVCVSLGISPNECSHLRRDGGFGGHISDWPCQDRRERTAHPVTRKRQKMSGTAGTRGVKVSAEIGGMLKSGNGFARELVNSGGLGELIG